MNKTNSPSQITQLEKQVLMWRIITLSAVGLSIALMLGFRFLPFLATRKIEAKEYILLGPEKQVLGSWSAQEYKTEAGNYLVSVFSLQSEDNEKTIELKANNRDVSLYLGESRDLNIPSYFLAAVHNGWPSLRLVNGEVANYSEAKTIDLRVTTHPSLNLSDGLSGHQVMIDAGSYRGARIGVTGESILDYGELRMKDRRAELELCRYPYSRTYQAP